MIVPLLIWTTIASAVSFVLYAIDKRCAVRQRRRIPESTLLTVDLLFGYPGGFFAQRFIRHKNRKRTYQIRFWLIVSAHVAAYAFFGIRALR